MSTVQRAVPKCIVLLVAWLALAGTASATTPVGQTSLDTLLHTCAIKPDGTPICWGKNSSRQATIPAGTGTVTAITVGFGHTCAIKADGSPTCWGDNSEGQTTVPAGIGTVTEINAGTQHTCAIKTGGIPVCWGSNRFGQLPIPAGIGTVTAITAGAGDTCVIKTGGTPVCWGDNSEGQTTIPAGIGSVTAISAGGAHTCAIKTDGTPVCWGFNGQGATTVPPGTGTVTAISVGAAHTCAIKTDGTPVCWGLNYHGDTIVPAGIGPVTAIAAGFVSTCAMKANGRPACWPTDPPPPDEDYGQSMVPAYSHPVNAIAAGSAHTCAIKPDDTLACWGTQLGAQADVPAGIVTVTAISASAVGNLVGEGHTCVIKTDGTPVCWGQNGEGEATVPAGIGAVTAVSAGRNHTCAIKVDRTPVCWGYNGDGQTDVPAGIGTVTAISAGGNHTCAIKVDGTPVCWGAKDHFIGNFFFDVDLGQADVPAGIGAVTAISAGRRHTCAIKVDGTPVCWGYSNDGQTDVPAGIGTVTAISASADYTCAIKTDGTPICWGEHDAVGFGVVSSVPAGTVTAITTGELYACAIRTDGTPTCWGLNDQRQLGEEPSFTSAPPPDGGGGAYSHRYTAGGAPAPSFSVVAGDLPPGLSLDSTTGLLSGTPTRDGIYTGTVRAASIFSPDADQAFSITIDATAPTVTLTDPVDGSVTSDASPEFAGRGGTAPGDDATVSVRIWAGSSVGTGAPDYSVSATVDPETDAFSSSGPYTKVSDLGTVETLPDGTYTARAFQSDSLDNGGQSAVSATFTIDTTSTITFEPLPDRVYGDTFTPSATNTAGRPVAFSSSGSCVVADGRVRTTAVGTCTVTAGEIETGAGRAASVQRTFTVAPRPITATAADASRVYGAANGTLRVALTGDDEADRERTAGLLAADRITATGTTAASPRTAVTERPAILPDLSDPDGRVGNYRVTRVNGALTITKAPLLAAAKPATRIYGRENPTLEGELTGLIEGDDITAAWITHATRNTDVGTYAILPDLTDPDGRLENYDVERRDGELTITKADLSVVADDQARDYGDANPELTGTLRGVVEGDAIDAVYATVADRRSDVGEYAITADLTDPDGRLGNYDVARTDAKLTVRKRPLAAETDDVRWRFGDDRPALTGTLTGVANDDPVSATYTSDAAPTRDDVPGEYTIAAHVTGSDAVLANYAITETAGKLSVYDGYAPKLTVPADDLVEATGPDGATVPFSATADDDVDRAPSVVCTPGSPAGLAIGAHTVSCTATDKAGNAATQTFAITVRDTTAPKLTVPASFAVDATGPDGATVPFSVSATDLVDAARAVTCTRPVDGADAPVASGARFPIGDTVVTCTSADTRGNTTAEKFTVTVRSASQQATRVDDAITAMHLDATVASQLQQKADAIVTALVSTQGKPCNDLNTFDNTVRAKAGKPKGVTTEQAKQLYDATIRIRAVTGGCPK